MGPRRAVGGVAAGAAVTVVLCVVTAVALPFPGLATAAVVGTGVPVWAFGAPVALGAAAGGSTAGVLHDGGPREGALGGAGVAVCRRQLAG